MRCPFCQEVAAGQGTAANKVAVALPDAYPLSEGHTLIVSQRHEADFFALSDSEQAGMWALARDVHRQLSENSIIAGFNVGINVGAAAGQTMDHAHIHLIPRREGDHDDPRAGVRWVLPERARYWDL